jgi:histidinol-phosphatase
VTPDAFGEGWSASRRRGTDAELDDWLASALAWCDEADAIASSSFRQELRITEKVDRTLVTEADTTIERLLRERIAARYANHGIFGEEFADTQAGSSVRWYIDPIDGTHNFVRRIPVFATLVAVARDGELQAAVVSAPELGTRWYARRGGGAWATDAITAPGAATDAAGAARVADAGASAARRSWGPPRRIRVSRIERLAEAQLLYSSPASVVASPDAPGFDRLRSRVWRERGFGDFWMYMLIAQGSAEASVEVGPSAYDLAAPALIVEEAGGRVTDLTGHRRIDGGGAVATNGILHDAVLAELAGS